MTALLRVTDLAVGYAGGARALDGVDLEVERGETLAIVGESGSGKTTLGLAIGRLLPAGAGRESGELEVAGVPVFDAGSAEIRRLRRKALGFVFQNPMTALDPTMRIARQVRRAFARPVDGSAVAGLLARAGLPEPERVARSFPHELSGGMAQRVVIAMAIARGPALLVADEPTASLDASVRQTVATTLVALSSGTGAALIILSHDLRLVGRHCARIAVMYGGRIVEIGAREAVFGRPAHPYTRALIAAAAGNERPGDRLQPIPGAPPLLRGRLEACPFAPRCPLRRDRCETVRPERRVVADREVVCHFAEEVLASSTVTAEPAGARP